MSAMPVDMAAILRWDVRNWARAVDFWDASLPADLAGQSALEIGAGEGGISLFLADRGCNVTCTDYTSTAAQALKHHRRHGLDGRMRYTRTDALSLPFPDGSFDVAAFKSVLGGIGRHRGIQGQHRTVRELHRVLKPGGILVFADNLRASWLHRFMRHTFVPWGHDWRYPSLGEFRDFFAIFERAEIRTFGVIAAIGRTEAQRRYLHYVDGILSPVTPPAARYIGYGCAIK